MRKITLVGAALAALALAALPAHAADKIKLAGVFTVSSALPYYVAEEKGYFKAADLDVEKIHLQAAPFVVQALINGDADAAANLVSLEAANINSRRAGTVVFFAMFGQNRTYHMEQFVVRPDHPAKTMKEMKGGMKLFVSAGPANAAAARAALKANGLVEGTDFTIAELPLPQHVGALKAKTFDGGYTLEPFATIAERENAARRIEIGVISTYILKRPDALSFAAGTGFSQKFLTEKPAVAKRFADAWAKAIADIEKDGPGIRDLLVKHMNTPAAIAPTMVILKAKMVRDMTDQETADFQSFIDFGTEYGIVPSKIDVKTFLSKL